MSLANARNVILRDYDGNVLAGFWQYGSISWHTFATLLHNLIHTNESWAIFEFDENSPNRHGTQQYANDVIVPSGVYVLLQQDGSPVEVRLTDASARLRQPTHSNTPTQLEHYRQRTRDRDRKCLITGLESPIWSRLKTAHIFPRVHDMEWNRKGYPFLITDPAPISALGGRTKIDSIQNMILLRSDLRDAWDNYEFGVNPEDNYRITAFINGLDDVHGLTLRLDHIADRRLRPLDELFRDHFLQCVLKHMKGVGELTWDYEDNLSDGGFDLSRENIWSNAEGKERLELELADRLFEHRVAQDLQL